MNESSYLKLTLRKSKFSSKIHGETATSVSSTMQGEIAANTASNRKHQKQDAKLNH